MLEGLEDGHRFNCGVVYLPPSAARDGVAELIRVNPELKKIFIVTEKLSVHDSREIRAMGQQNGIDIFGGNSLGVADAWNHVRIGGALGGDSPEEALRKGSIAIFSNSGNFTTTIATYLRMAGWGTTTLISSGKDVYIHYRRAGVCLRARQRRAQQGGGAVCRAGRLLRARCRVQQAGRRLRGRPLEAEADARGRPCRRAWPAAAMTPRAKERWFMEKFGVDRRLHAGRSGRLSARARWSPTSPISRRR